MAELNKKLCVVKGANTGFGDCVFSVSHIIGAFLVPSNLRLTPADLAALQTTLQTKAFATNPKERIYPIHDFEQMTDGSEDKNVQTLGYGGKYPLVEGDYDWTFQYLQGGHCLHKNLRNFNGLGRTVLFYDSNGMLLGQKIGEDLAGVPLVYFYANKFALSDGSNATAYTVQFVSKPRYLNDDIGFVEMDFNPVNVKGLQDVALFADATSTVADPVIKAFVGCDRANMYDLYETDLAVPGAWVATINGAPVAITGVAATPAVQGWTITLDVADPNYSAAGPVTISLASPTALGALDVVGFESNSVTVTA